MSAWDGTFVPGLFGHTPWLTKKEVYQLLADIDKLLKWCQTQAIVHDDVYTAEVQRSFNRGVVASIYFSNMVEDSGADLGDTSRLVMFVLENKTLPAPVQPLTLKQSQKEITQHAEAFYQLIEYARQDAPLTVSMIKETHATLMNDLMPEGKPAGNFRDHPANAGFYVFAPARSLAPLVREMLDEYERKATSSNPFALAAWLMYQFVTIHPFADGNGRMCRMLANFVLVRARVPLCTAFGFGVHKGTRAKYIGAIRNARRYRNTHRLSTIVLEDILYNLRTLHDNVVRATAQY